MHLSLFKYNKEIIVYSVDFFTFKRSRRLLSFYFFSPPSSPTPLFLLFDRSLFFHLLFLLFSRLPIILYDSYSLHADNNITKKRTCHFLNAHPGGTYLRLPFSNRVKYEYCSNYIVWVRRFAPQPPQPPAQRSNKISSLITPVPSIWAHSTRCAVVNTQSLARRAAGAGPGIPRLPQTQSLHGLKRVTGSVGNLKIRQTN